MDSDVRGRPTIRQVHSPGPPESPRKRVMEWHRKRRQQSDAGNTFFSNRSASQRTSLFGPKLSSAQGSSTMDTNRQSSSGSSSKELRVSRNRTRGQRMGKMMQRFHSKSSTGSSGRFEDLDESETSSILGRDSIIRECEVEEGGGGRLWVHPTHENPLTAHDSRDGSRAATMNLQRLSMIGVEARGRNALEQRCINLGNVGKRPVSVESGVGVKGGLQGGRSFEAVTEEDTAFI